jgi:hypothetical protein
MCGRLLRGLSATRFVRNAVCPQRGLSATRFVRNGETVVCVRAASDEGVEFAADTLRQYDPIAINVLSFSSELELR